MSRTPSAHNLPEEAQALHAALTLAAEEHRPPCKDKPEWTSEDADDRLEAAWACLHACPIRLECERYAVSANELFGVWAGVDRGDPNARRRQKRGAAA